MKVPIFVGFPVESPTYKATASKRSSKGNFFVRVRFEGVPSTVEEVVRVRFCSLSFLSLFVWNSLFFFPCEEFLVFSSVFPFFSLDFRGSVGIKDPGFFGGFSCLFSKKKTRKGRTGQGCLLS